MSRLSEEQRRRLMDARTRAAPTSAGAVLRAPPSRAAIAVYSGAGPPPSQAASASRATRNPTPPAGAAPLATLPSPGSEV